MAEYSLHLSFNANGGTGAPSTVIQNVSSTAASVTVTATIPSTRPTRYGYNFGGWSGNGGTYQPSANVSKTFTRQFDDQGNIINQSATIYFSAIWYVQISSWGSTPSSVQLNGSTSYTFNINKAGAVDHHTVTFKLGSQTLTYTNVGASVTTTFPTSWQAQLPNATSGSITCTLTSYNSGGSKLGSTSKTITGNVPSSVVPTLSVTHERINSNSTVAGWGILLQGFSRIKFTATAAGASGSTISAITFSGAGLSQSSTSTTATSNTLNVYGSQTWTITAKDSRGRTASTTYTELVYYYAPPSISTASAKRCDSGGTINEATGTYARFNGTYSYSVYRYNAITQKIDSKLHSGSTWTTRATSYTSDTNVVIGGGAFDADKTYDIRLTITDSLGNSATYSVFLASVQGFALGLKNDRARFGGVPTQSGLEVDWDAQFDGMVDVVNRRSYATLSSAGWYRVLTYAASNADRVLGDVAFIVDIAVLEHSRQAHKITLFGVLDALKFGNEVSVTDVNYIDKIRYMRNGSYGYIDVHYSSASTRSCACYFNIQTNYLEMQTQFTANSFDPVADAPAGETIVESYDFVQNAISGIITTEISITTDSTGYYNVSAYPRDKYMILNVLPLLKSDYYAMPTGSSGTTGQWVRVHKADGTAAASESMTIRLAMIHI